MKRTLQIRLFLNIGSIVAGILAITLIAVTVICTELPFGICVAISISPVILFFIAVWATRFFSPSRTQITHCPACGANLVDLYDRFTLVEPTVCPYCGFDLNADEPTTEERLAWNGDPNGRQSEHDGQNSEGKTNGKSNEEK